MKGDAAGPTDDARTDIGYHNVGSVSCVVHGIAMAFIR
jgi:hypothetical protein